jgi:ABC-2 type transport system ATP-binding protein
MIIVQDLHKSFGSFAALRGISLTVRRGEIYGFIGQNGAGKTTTMNILAGLSHPSSGSCRVNGRDVRSIRHPSELQIGYLPENPAFYAWMTANETLAYLSGSGKTDTARLLEWVGLTDAARRKVGGFSRGMRQRLGLAAALVHDPDLLILDEPSSALDPEGRSDVLRLIRELKQRGKTVLLLHPHPQRRGARLRFGRHYRRRCHASGKTAPGAAAAAYCPYFRCAAGLPCPPDLAISLKAHPLVLAMEEQPDQLTVTVRDAAAGSVWLMEQLAARQLAVLSLTQRAPTLEDIFIREVNGHETGNA